MFRRMDDFKDTWQVEAEKTLAVLDAISDAHLDQAVAPGHRDLRRLGWHLVESLIEMPSHLGLKLEGSHLIDGMFIKAPPATGAEIRNAYAAASASLLAATQAWKDADLEREDDLYGETWKRGKTLAVLVAHQTHHRGQMTVLMRQAGIKVPDVYGPAKEGWAAYAMEAPTV
jgi:uncharacterized damage-inducible protein DinB